MNVFADHSADFIAALRTELVGELQSTALSIDPLSPASDDVIFAKELTVKSILISELLEERLDHTTRDLYYPKIVR